VLHAIPSTLCVCNDSRHCGCWSMYCVIAGSTAFRRLHSGCKYSKQSGGTQRAFSSAHAKSASESIIIFSSLACLYASAMGGRWRFGERHTQSHSPENGSVPDVSRCVRKPALCSARHNSPSGCNNGSPPVTMAIRAGKATACRTISSIGTTGKFSVFHVSLESHQGHALRQPAKRINTAACPV